MQEVECSLCGKKFKNLGSHNFRKHRGQTTALAVAKPIIAQAPESPPRYITLSTPIQINDFLLHGRVRVDSNARGITVDEKDNCFVVDPNTAAQVAAMDSAHQQEVYYLNNERPAKYVHNGMRYQQFINLGSISGNEA